MERISIEDVRATTYKRKDSWWTVFLVDPYASRLVRLVAGYRWITPNRLTIAATLLGMASAVCFAMADWGWLVAGAALFHLSFVVDCMDGKVARLQGTGSVFGSWLDYIFDRFRVLACAVALMGGLYRETDRTIYLVLAFGVVVLDLFHYLDLLQIGKVKAEMRRQLTAAQEAYAQVTGATAADPAGVQPGSAQSGSVPGQAGVPVQATGPGQATTAATVSSGTRAGAAANVGQVSAAQPRRADGSADPAGLDPEAQVVESQVVYELTPEFRSRFGAYVRLRSFLLNNRIRPNLVSGIEFHMAVFIVGPVIGPAAIIPVTLLMGGLLLTIELAVIYKLWLAANAFNRKLAKLQRDTEAALAAQTPAEQAAAEQTATAPTAQARTLEPAAGRS